MKNYSNVMQVSIIFHPSLSRCIELSNNFWCGGSDSRTKIIEEVAHRTSHQSLLEQSHNFRFWTEYLWRSTTSSSLRSVTIPPFHSPQKKLDTTNLFQKMKPTEAPTVPTRAQVPRTRQPHLHRSTILATRLRR